MKLNISDPSTGAQKVIEIEDESKLRPLFDKRISHEVDGEEFLGPEWKGYAFRITGGNDKQGFPMLQGVLTAARVRLLFQKGSPCYRPRKRGERKKKSVRGAVVSSELSVINLRLVKKGPSEIPGLTDTSHPRRLGPKRASKIRKLFGLEKKEDVRVHVIKRDIIPKQKEKKEDDGEGGSEKPSAPAAKVKKPYKKAPRIQRLVTPQRLQRKRNEASIKRHRWEKSRKEAEEYNKLLAQRLKERRAGRESKLAKKRSVSRLTPAEGAAAAAPEQPKPAAPAKKPEQKKPEPKPEAKKADAKKPEAKKPEAKKPEAKKADTKAAAKPDAKAKPQEKPKAEPKPKADPKPAAKAEPKADPKPKPDAKAAGKTEAKGKKK